MSELAALSTVFVIVGFFVFFETTLPADGRSGGVGTATCNCITCAHVGDRDVRMSSGCASICCRVGIAGSPSAASATHTHTHTSTTAGVDDDMGHTRMTSDDLSVHSDGWHPTGDVGYLLAFGFDASRSRELVPVSELSTHKNQKTDGSMWDGDVHQDVQ